MQESIAFGFLSGSGRDVAWVGARYARGGRYGHQEDAGALGRAAGRDTLYLSMLTLAPAHPAATRDLASPYELHRTLARVFGEVEPGAQRDLWRQEGRAILVQSPTPGRWERLEEGYCEALEADRARRLADGAVPDAGWRFRLSANPAVRVGGRRRGLVHADEALVWLHRQGRGGGFTVERASMPKIERLEIRNARTDARMGFIRASFEGILTVCDGARFGAVLERGLGHGKAFGMGLLAISPV